MKFWEGFTDVFRVLAKAIFEPDVWGILTACALISGVCVWLVSLADSWL